MPLNPRQQAFVEAYIRSGNATQAYADAYGCENRDTANANAARLLANASVKEAVEAARRQAMEAVGLGRVKWAAEVAILAFSDATAFAVDDAGRVRSTGHPDAVRAVSSVKLTRRQRVTGTGRNRRVETTTQAEVKLWSKPEALRMAGYALGILKGTLEVPGALNVNLNLGALPDDDLDQLEAILSRAAAADPGAGAGGEGPPPAQ